MGKRITEDPYDVTKVEHINPGTADGIGLSSLRSDGR